MQMWRQISSCEFFKNLPKLKNIFFLPASKVTEFVLCRVTPLVLYLTLGGMNRILVPVS